MTESPQPVHLRFTYTAQDWFRADRLNYRVNGSSLREKLFAVVLFLAALTNFYLLTFPGLEFSFRNILYFLSAFLLLFLAFAYWFDLRNLTRLWVKSIRNRNKPPVEYVLTFDETGARYLREGIDVKLPWKEFSQIVEDQNYLLLILKASKKQYWNLPKDYFNTPSDIDALRSLANASIAKESGQPTADFNETSGE